MILFLGKTLQISVTDDQVTYDLFLRTLVTELTSNILATFEVRAVRQDE